MRKRVSGRPCAYSLLEEACLAAPPVSVSGKRSAGRNLSGAPAFSDVRENRDERAIVKAAQAGDPEAIRALYDAYRDRIWKILLYMLGDLSQVQDVFQVVFFKFFRGLSGFRFQSSLFTWLYRIARNECVNNRRRLRLPCVPLEEILGGRDEIDPRTDAEAETQWERERILRQAVRRLPPKMREVVVLKYVEELSYEEIGQALGCAAGTVASRLSRALTELGTRLEPVRRWL